MIKEGANMCRDFAESNAMQLFVNLQHELGYSIQLISKAEKNLQSYAISKSSSEKKVYSPQELEELKDELIKTEKKN